ncbi:unnamed protein product [Sympodiomycopsis kandeliae]
MSQMGAMRNNDVWKSSIPSPFALVGDSQQQTIASISMALLSSTKSGETCKSRLVSSTTCFSSTSTNKTHSYSGSVTLSSRCALPRHVRTSVFHHLSNLVFQSPYLSTQSTTLRLIQHAKSYTNTRRTRHYRSAYPKRHCHADQRTRQRCRQPSSMASSRWWYLPQTAHYTCLVVSKATQRSSDASSPLKTPSQTTPPSPGGQPRWPKMAYRLSWYLYTRCTARPSLARWNAYKKYKGWVTRQMVRAHSSH